MNTIKAIETSYKGYRFRSRLEARWAVFFDALGLRWEYEPEGFELRNGLRYLPDFRITGVDTNQDPYTFWFEVKPGGVEVSAKDKEKMQAFVDAEIGLLILLDGPPEVRAYEGVDGNCLWYLWSIRRRPWWLIGEEPFEFLGPLDDWYQGGGEGFPLLHWERAITAARSARFEHGECGAAA